MDEEQAIGNFSLGGPRYYLWRDTVLALLVIFCYLSFYIGMPTRALRPETGLILTSVAYLSLLGIVGFALFRRFVVENVYIDHQRGQLVKQRTLLGMKQIVPLANIEEIKSVATAGVDSSLAGTRAPRSVGYVVTGKGETIPVAETTPGETESNRLAMKKLSESLDVPFFPGTTGDRIQVSGERVDFQDPPGRLLRLRAVFTIPALIVLLGFFYVATRVFWFRLFVL